MKRPHPFPDRRPLCPSRSPWAPLALVFLFATIPCSQAIGLISVSNSTVVVNDISGNAVSNTSGWMLRLYTSSNSFYDFNSGMPHGDDSYTGLEATWAGTAPGFFSFAVTNPPAYGIAVGDYLYAVLVNAPTFTGANFYAVLGSAVVQVQDYSTSWHFDPGGASPGSWVAKAQGPEQQYGGLVLSEILFDPNGPDAGYQWIELYNYSSVPIDTASFYLRQGAILHPISSSMVPPGGTVVIAQDITNFWIRYPGFSGNIAATPYAPAATGEAVELMNGTNYPADLVDCVDFTDPSFVLPPATISHHLNRTVPPVLPVDNDFGYQWVLAYTNDGLSLNFGQETANPGKQLWQVLPPGLETEYPQSVTSNSAVIGVNLFYAGGSSNLANAGIVWGPIDQGTNGGAWAYSHGFGQVGNGLYMTNVTGLTPNTLYYCRALAANEFGMSWAASTHSFFTTGSGTSSTPYFTVSGIPFPAFVGQALSPTLTVWDGTNIMVSYTGTVTFSSPTYGTLPSLYTFTPGDSGVHTFTTQLTFLMSAEYTDLTVQDLYDPFVKGSARGISVFNGSGSSYDRFVISGVADPTTTGVWHTVSVAAVDNYMNIHTGYLGAVYFSSTDPLALLPSGGGPYAFTPADAGLHTFPVNLQFNTIGEQRLSVYDLPGSNSLGRSNTLPFITVQGTGGATGVTHLVIEHPVQISLGNWNCLSIEARDASERTEPSYLGTVDITCSDPAANFPASHTFQTWDNGRYFASYAVSFNTAGSNHWLQAVDRNNTNLICVLSNIVAVGYPPPVSTYIHVPDLGPVVVGHPVTLTTTLLDSPGVTNTSFAETLTFSFDPTHVSGPTSHTFTVADAGTKTFTNGFVFHTAGEHSIFISSTNYAIGSVSLYVEAIPGGSGPTLGFMLMPSATPSLAGNYEAIRVAAVGPGNIINTNHSAMIVFSSSDTDAVFSSATFSAFSNGMAEIPGLVNFANAGWQTLRASLQSDPAIFGEESVRVVSTTALRFVDGTGGSDSADGLSPASGWLTLAHAMTQLAPGHTLFVRPGVYYEPLDITRSGTPGEPISIVGDMHASFWADKGQAFLSPTGGPSLQIIGHSNLFIDGIHPGYSLSSNTVFLQDAQDVAIDNMGISSGTLGVDIRSSSRIRFRHSEIQSCSAGAILIQSNSSDIVVSDCTLKYNSPFGIKAIDSGYVRVDNSVIQSATGDGIVAIESGIGVHSNEIAYLGGRAMAVTGLSSFADITHNQIFGNSASWLGKGILIENAPAPVIVNNTLVMNDHGIELVNSPSASIENNIIAFNWGNGLAADAASQSGLMENYNCIYGGMTNWSINLTAGTGSFSADPQFASTGYGYEEFHLKSTVGRRGPDGWTNDTVSSPCIDAANPAEPYGREPLPNGSRMDMGVYGNTLEASLSPTYVSLVVTSPMGTPYPPPGTNLYEAGTVITASIPPNLYGGTFTQHVNLGWTGSGSTPAAGSTNTVMITLTTNSTLQWLWQTEVFLAAYPATGGGSVTTSNGWYALGSTPTLTAAPDVGYHFNAWVGDISSTNNPLSITMTQTYAVQATFAADLYDITASSTSNGLVSPTGTVYAFYSNNQFYSIIPDPNYHAVDVLVDGASIGPTNSYLFAGITNGGHTLFASFAPDTHTLQVTTPYGVATPSGTITANWGTVISASVAGSPVIQGGTQYLASGWVGTGAVPSGTGTNTSFNLTSDSTLQWNWSTDYLLSLLPPVNGTLSSTAAWVVAGLYVPLTATPAPGYSFAGWNGDVPGVAAASNPIVVLMDQARTLGASFVSETGGICIILQPAQAVSDGARWRLLSGPDTNWQSSSASVYGITATGSPYSVTFEVIPSWTAPADLTSIGIINGGVTTLTATYIQSSMVLIPGGTFPMGMVSGSGGRNITLSDFYLDRAPVTVDNYMDFATATLRPMPTAPAWGWSNSNLPMVNITWNDAAAYAAYVGKRLPTEAEYEYAMRSGFTNRTYPWGNSISSANANYASAIGQPTPAGNYATNAFGLQDIAGNVWSWCSDWYQSTLTGAATNPAGPATGQYKVIRGGGWASSSLRLQCAPRFSQAPASAYVDVGFRCAADVIAAGGWVASGDANGNDVADWWEQQHFGLSGFNPTLDSDHDGLLDAEEYVAGTDPTSSVSVLNLLTPTNPATGNFNLRWPSTAGRVYDVLRARQPGAAYTVIATALTATPPENTYTDSSGGDTAVYKIGVR